MAGIRALYRMPPVSPGGTVAKEPLRGHRTSDAALGASVVGHSQVTARPLKVGVFVPTWTEGSALPAWTTAETGGRTRWSDIVATAELAEASGLDSVWVCDHMLLDDDWEVPDPPELRPTTGATGCWDAWGVLAALAARTSRIAIGSLVACTAYVNPARLARLADTVDEISGGRLILGLGAGDHWSEFQRFGYPLDRPIARFEEALQIIGPLLRQGAVDFEGTFYTARDCALSPRARESGPPILIGALGTGPRMNRLVVQHADLWNGWYTFNSTDPLPELRAQLARIDQACVDRGRDPRSLGRTAGVSVAFAGAEAESGSISGSDAQIAARFQAYADAGVDHLQVVVSPGGPRGVERLARVVEQLGAPA